MGRSNHLTNGLMCGDNHCLPRLHEKYSNTRAPKIHYLLKRLYSSDFLSKEAVLGGSFEVPEYSRAVSKNKRLVSRTIENSELPKC